MARHGPIEKLLQQLGVAYEKLKHEDTETEQKKWRSTFAQRVKETTGNWVHLGFDWHAFSYEFVFAQSGDEARNSYSDRKVQVFLILPHMDSEPAFRCTAATLPDFSHKAVDAYICPRDYEWTMIFTHEDDCGPYFTTKAWAAKREPASS